MTFFLLLFCLAMPDVITKDITPDHEFIVLACDGEYLIVVTGGGHVKWLA